MLNNKIIGLFVLGLALSSPLQNANAAATPTLGLQTVCYKTDGCKDGYTLSADGTKCISNCATGTYVDQETCESAHKGYACTKNSSNCYAPNGCKLGYSSDFGEEGMGGTPIGSGDCWCIYNHPDLYDTLLQDEWVKSYTTDKFGCLIPNNDCVYKTKSACESDNNNRHSYCGEQAMYAQFDIGCWGPTICKFPYRIAGTCMEGIRDDIDANGCGPCECPEGYVYDESIVNCVPKYQGCEYSSIEDCQSKNSFAICEEVSGSHIGGGDDGQYVCPEVVGCQEGMGLNSMGDCEPVQAKTCETTDTGSAYMKYATGMSCPSEFSQLGGPVQVEGVGSCMECCKYTQLTCYNSGAICEQRGNCYVPTSCREGYSMSADGYCVADGNACNPSTYDAFLSALSNSACTTVTLAANIDGQDDSNAANLEVPANKVINGNGKTLKMSRTLSLGGSTNIENLTLINHTRDAIYIASGADTLNGVKIETVGVGININMPYMMSGTNTIKVYGSNAVGISAPNNSSILSMLSGTLDINASNGATGIQLSNEYSEIVVDSGATLNINIMDGYAIASTGGLLNIDGTLNIDHDGPQNPVYGTSSTLTIEGEGDINIVTNSIADTINVASLQVYLEGTLNIEAPVANGAYFIKSANGSFNFYSGDSELITKSTGSRTFSSTDVGLKINVVEMSPNAIWHVIGSGYSNRWKAYNNLNCMSGYNKTYPTNSCWLNTSLSTDPV